MSFQKRQNTLFVAEDWKAIYEALPQIDFTALDQESIRRAIVQHIQTNYPDLYNDWIVSSEYIVILDTLTWLAQNINYRIDLNIREAFITLAEKRESLLRLAENIGYRPKRTIAAKGELKVMEIQTNQQLRTPQGDLIRGAIRWNDVADSNWIDKWRIIMNAAFDQRSKWGKPIKKVKQTSSEVSLYRLNSPAPASSVYLLNSALQDKIVAYNCDLSDDGVITERGPGFLSFHMLYRNSGQGYGSANTGFMVPIVQGQMNSYDFSADGTTPNTFINIDTDNIVENGVWLFQYDPLTGNPIKKWSNVKDLDVAYNLSFRGDADIMNVYDVVTRANDRISLRFGDGINSNIPNGIYRVWYRTISTLLSNVNTFDTGIINMTIPYVSDDRTYDLSMKMELVTAMEDSAVGDSDEDLRTKAPVIFRTQDRMVTAQDYNVFPLTDNRIMKLKAVNRTFIGDDLSKVRKDPTGLYGELSFYADDGRIYKDTLEKETVFFFDPLETTNTFIARTLSKSIKELDKSFFYQDNYDAIQTDLVFTKTQIKGNRTFGKLNRAAPSNLKVGALIKFLGTSARIDEIIGNGTTNNSVVLRGIFNDPEFNINEYYPWMSQKFTEDELTKISDRLLIKKQFGIRWDINTATWAIISSANLSVGDFSLTYAGDTANLGRDSSWIFLLKYNMSQNGEEIWTIKERSTKIIFANDGSTRFVFTDNPKIVDPNTGVPKRDTIVLLKNNETRDSPTRRGIKTPFVKEARNGKFPIIGNGTTRIFQISTDLIDKKHVFLETNGVLSLRDDWKLAVNQGMTQIVFDSPLTLGETINVVVDQSRTTISNQRLNDVGQTNQNFFVAGTTNVISANMFVFVDGFYKSPSADYQVFDSGLGARLRFNEAPLATKPVTIFSARFGLPVFVDMNFLGDGVNLTFNTRTEFARAYVFVNGVYQHTGYVVNESVLGAFSIDFAVAPANNAKITVKLLIDNRTVRIDENAYIANPAQRIFEPPTSSSYDKLIVFVNGVYQHQATFDQTTNDVVLSAPLAGGERVLIINLTKIVSEASGLDVGNRQLVELDPINLKNDITLNISNNVYDTTGIIYPNSLEITNIDQYGYFDHPTLFNDLVVEDGVSDLVLWRSVNGRWMAISEKTTPKGTYHGFRYVFAAGEALINTVTPGDIHYDLRTNQWLKADPITNTWIVENSNLYRKRIGRDRLRFKWNHYSSDDYLLDPSNTNIVDMHVLTTSYMNSVRRWVDNGGAQPVPETPEQLRAQFSYLENKKMVSDTLVWWPTRFKFLFGANADNSLKAKFLIIRSPGSSLSDSDIKLRVLDALEIFFEPSNWDFGETFYFTELSSFMHQYLAPNIQSVVPVSASGEKFGQMFEVRAEPDEFFMSTATVSDIEIVDKLSDSRLNR